MCVLREHLGIIMCMCVYKMNPENEGYVLG